MFNDVSTPKNEKDICMETFQERHNSSGEIAVVILFFTSLLPFFCLLKILPSAFGWSKQDNLLSSLPMHRAWTNN
jgi:hypothetical protein